MAKEKSAKSQDAVTYSQSEILDSFSVEEQQDISYKLKVLSSLAYFICRDPSTKFELNEPDKGWRWNFVDNIIKADPVELLERPMDELRFVTAHEGGHRKITRLNDIPQKIWAQIGFPFMTNVIEDPRTNNFLAETYHRIGEYMSTRYDHNFRHRIEDEILKDFTQVMEKTEQMLGRRPRFIQAGFEYLWQWYREVLGDGQFVLSDNLPEDVRSVVKQTLDAAQGSWWLYPSREEAEYEDYIQDYAGESYKINRDEIWPKFKTLVEADMEDQVMQEGLQDMDQERKKKGGDYGLPSGLKDKLTDDEKKDLEDEFDKDKQKNNSDELEPKSGAGSDTDPNGNDDVDNKNSKPIDLEALSPELKQKLAEYFNSLPDDQREKLEQRAAESLQEFELEIIEVFGAQFADDPGKMAGRGLAIDEVGNEESSTTLPDLTAEQSKDLAVFKSLLEKKLKEDANLYETYRREVLSLINKLENELRKVFIARRARKKLSGFRFGKRINIKRRIREKARGIPAVRTRAFERKSLPQERDYAISILVDLSSSMEGEKIEETFKALIVLTEVLNKLSINLEIIGFNTKLYEFQSFGQRMGDDIRGLMSGILEVPSSMTDLGWAVQEVSARLDHQKEKEKFLIVLSDGRPEESGLHSRDEYELSGVVGKIRSTTNQKLIGLGIGPGTEHVEVYFPNNLANIGVVEMSQVLADLILEVIINFNTF